MNRVHFDLRLFALLALTTSSVTLSQQVSDSAGAKIIRYGARDKARAQWSVDPKPLVISHLGLSEELGIGAVETGRDKPAKWDRSAVLEASLPRDGRASSSKSTPTLPGHILNHWLSRWPLPRNQTARDGRPVRKFPL